VSRLSDLAEESRSRKAGLQLLAAVTSDGKKFHAMRGLSSCHDRVPHQSLRSKRSGYEISRDWDAYYDEARSEAKGVRSARLSAIRSAIRRTFAIRRLWSFGRATGRVRKPTRSGGNQQQEPIDSVKFMTSFYKDHAPRRLAGTTQQQPRVPSPDHSSTPCARRSTRVAAQSSKYITEKGVR